MKVEVAPAGLVRRPSDATLELEHFFHRPVCVLALVKHFLASVFFSSMGYVYFVTREADVRTVQMFAPGVVGTIMGCFAALHMYGLICVMCGRGWQPLHQWTAFRWPLISLPPASQLVVFHAIDVACQSYQAFNISYSLPDRATAFALVVVVALNCSITPWFLLSKHHLVQRSVVPLLQSLFGFVVSTLFHYYVFLIPALIYTIQFQTMRYDTLFVIRLVLVTRCTLVTSLLDLVTKVVVQFSSYLALRKLVASMQQGTMRRPSLASASRLSKHFHLDFHQRRGRIAYAVCASLWGVALVTTSKAANWDRAPCPSTCEVAVSPWWTQTCECAYVRINCALQRLRGESIDDQLDPAVLGTGVISIDVRRCALPHGIPMATLAPFQRLFVIHITFSNMTSWAHDPTNQSLGFPPSLANLGIRYSKLTAVPTVLLSLPPNIIYLTLEGASIATIPDAFFAAWSNVTSFWLLHLNLTQVPTPLATHPTPLEYIAFTGNQIQSVPLTWQPPMTRLRGLDLSANALTDGPWHLVRPNLQLELSSNPIATVPTTVDPALLANRVVVLDDTPYCATKSSPPCLPKCSPLCHARMIGNHRCDWTCYSAACSYDGGDCDTFGFELV
ncbi:Aste57867_8459 [Aphanomyces stellatus]|uniref:Aste57867_8459 protein n=1 Tax=Aphanomyces stellatus TaxID=120398 RepID=A0A485KKA6_9STRA|nr:hypothetical protein As57867_008427 [Aphanomyces stellatus]VFT85345.1 Aste57867_8459 [Aphanomyces stellatus]